MTDVYCKNPCKYLSRLSDTSHEVFMEVSNSPMYTTFSRRQTHYNLWNSMILRNDYVILGLASTLE